MSSSPSSSSLHNTTPSGSEGDLGIMDQRKRKRMISNRESARRSRMRKQQHLDNLIEQVDQIKKENDQINAKIGMTTQMYLNVEAENAILRAQMAELSNRLQSLNEIIHVINSSNIDNIFDETQLFNDCGFMDPWNSLSAANQPIMASASDMLMY